MIFIYRDQFINTLSVFMSLWIKLSRCMYQMPSTTCQNILSLSWWGTVKFSRQWVRVQGMNQKTRLTENLVVKEWTSRTMRLCLSFFKILSSRLTKFFFLVQEILYLQQVFITTFQPVLASRLMFTEQDSLSFTTAMFSQRIQSLSPRFSFSATLESSCSPPQDDLSYFLKHFFFSLSNLVLSQNNYLQVFAYIFVFYSFMGEYNVPVKFFVFLLALKTGRLMRNLLWPLRIYQSSRSCYPFIYLMQITLSKAYQRAPSTKMAKPGFSFVLEQPNYGSSLMPNNFFWKYLVRRQRKTLPILIPDTIVSAEAQFNPVWIYSKDGFLFSTEKFTQKEVANKFCSNAYPDQLVAVVKKPDFYTNGTRNQLHLCSCKNLVSSYNNSQRATDNCVFQRFVKGSGSRAFLCRTVLRLNGLSEGWILSNKNQFYKQPKKSKQSQNIVINTQEPSTLNVVHFTSGGPFRDTVRTLETLLKYVNQYHKLSLVELAGDFIKDESGVWWLVGIKYFRSSHSPEGLITLVDERQKRSVSVKKKVMQYKVTKMCAYCQKSCLEQHLSHKMTTKMIIETDKFLEHRGKKFDWLYRSDVPNLEFQSLYEQKTVCQRCYLLYKYIKELLDLQLRFANKVGIPITEGSKESIFDLSHLNTNAVCKERSLVTLKAGYLPSKIELGTSQINIQRNIPMKNDKIENKMFRYRVLLFFNLIKEVVDVQPHRNYYLEFNMFGQRVRYKLDVQPGQTQISINRFRLFYLFAPNPRALTDYFMQLKYLRLLIFRDDGKKSKEVFATLDLQISDFSSDKVQLREIYKMFNLKNSKWGWGLSASIGIVGSGQTVVKNLLLKPFKCIFLPPNDYFTCEPLPIEWETFLQQTYSQIASMQIIQSPDLMEPAVQSVMTKHASLFWGHDLPKIQEQSEFNTRISKSLHKIRRKVEFNV